MEVQHLLLAKYLFERGTDFVRQGDSAACGMAISLFQDAVEAFLWALAKESGARLKKEAGFDGLWRAVDEALEETKQKRLPAHSRMVELNKARIGFKHYGILPDPSIAPRLQSYAEDFLREGLLELTGVDYDELSLADLISDSTVRGEIKEAEKCLRAERYEDAALHCAMAERLASRRVAQAMPKLRVDTGAVRRAFGAKAERELSSAIRKVVEYLEGLQRLTLSAFLRVDPKAYVRFQRVVPLVTLLADEKALVRHRSEYEKADVESCTKYITDHCLAVQAQLGWGDASD
jgi:hypothetical protein